MRFNNFVVCLLSFVIVASVCAAQSGGSEVVGQILDQKGALIPGVMLALVNDATGYKSDSRSSNDGAFKFLSVAPGVYTLTTSQPDFESLKIPSIPVARNQRVDLGNLVLKIGKFGTNTTVAAETNPIETSSAAIQMLVTEPQMQDIPVIIGLGGRSIQAPLLGLIPGASNYNPTSTSLPAQVSINGSPVGGIGFSFNGIDNTALGSRGGGLLTAGPNQDAVAEFSALTQTFDASSGSMPVQVHLETKSGTNRYHGQLRFLHLDPTASARDFFDPAKKATYRTETGGLQFSGPVKLPGVYDGLNRTFFFFDGEYTRSRQPFTSSASVLSNAQRSGDFSALAPSAWPIDPLTGLPFPNGQIPAGRVLPQSRKFIDELIRPPASTTQLVDFYTQRPSSRQNTVRVDHRISSRDALSVNLFVSKDEQDTPVVAMQQGNSHVITRTHNLSIQQTHWFSARVVNSASFGMSQSHYEEATTGKLDATLKETGFNITSDSPFGYPGVSLSNTGNFNPGGGLSKDWTSLWNASENVEFITGSHVFKLGADIRVLRGTFRDESNGGTTGSFAFSSTNPHGTGNDVADFLLGLPSAYSQNSMNILLPRRLLTAFYFQDYLKLCSSLRLNLGLRYDLNGAWHDANGHAAVFRPGVQSSMVASAPAGMLFPGDVDPVTGRKITSSVTSANHLELGPRVGLVYAPAASQGLWRTLFGGAGHTSIRSGYGIYYVPIPQQAIYQTFSVPPYVLSVSRDADQLAASGGTFLNPWGTGVDPFALSVSPVNGRPMVVPVGGLSFVEPGAKEAYQQQWSLSISRQLPENVALSVSYIGNTTNHIFRQYEDNPGVLTPTATVNNVESRRQYSNFGSILGFTSDGKSKYHALQIEVNRRFTKSFQFNSSYAWSKSTDNGGSTIAPADRDATPWARSGFDRTHQLVMFGVLSLPSLQSSRLHPLLSGWRLTPVVTIRSGAPLNLRNRSDSTLRGSAPSTAEITGEFQRLDPREVHTFKLPNGNTVTGHFFFDPTVFSILTPVGAAQAATGNLGRDPFTGLGSSNVDVSLTKRFAISQRQGVEFRIDSTNVLNHAQFLQASVATGNPAFAQTNQTAGPRRVQFVLKYNF